MNIPSELDNILEKYRNHPDFLGSELTEANQRGGFDDTCLHIAARKGELSDIKILVAYGADVNLAGDLDFTPLHYAAMNGQLATIELLISLGANPNTLNEFSMTPLQTAESSNDIEVINAMRGHLDSV